MKATAHQKKMKQQDQHQSLQARDVVKSTWVLQGTVEEEEQQHRERTERMSAQKEMKLSMVTIDQFQETRVRDDMFFSSGIIGTS